MSVAEPACATVLAWLAGVADPEIPAVSICDLGIVRDVAWTGDGDERTLHVALTPTYSGCPAMREIADDVVALLRAHDIARVAIDVRLSPPWTTDWLTAIGREKLRAYGISPPRERDVAPATAPSTTPAHLDLVALLGAIDERVVCPRCSTSDVTLVSRFASTPCKALYRCTRCGEPFDHFKAH